MAIRLHRVTVAGIALLTAAVTALSTASVATASPPAGPDRTAGGASHVPTIAWAACEEAGFQCAEVPVPLDYDHPRGRTVSLALAKLPATDPARRIGTLFVNPGGPGGSGVDFVLGAGPDLFTPEVRARFDIVGFDPRGIIRSTPLRCFATQEEGDAAFAPFPYPNSRSKERQWVAFDRYLQTACDRRGGPILDHMSTANVARDLDLLRQAVGDRKLSYYGISYGSFLGNVYANMFPDNFRALVIDGVLDPIAWTTGRSDRDRQLPFSTRLRSAVGAQATLREFFRLCDAGGPNCAFAPNAARRYRNLYATLRRDPLVFTDEDGNSVRYDESFLVGDSLGPLYDSISWPEFAAGLAELETAVNTRRVSEPLRLAKAAAIPEDGYLNYAEGFPGVACTDSINPRSTDAWRRAAAISQRRDGIFGPLWTWITSSCSDWPGRDRDRYLGPFDRRTAQPVLVVGNLYDPATPYHGAVIADRLLPNSGLLTVRAWAHTSLFQSTCADDRIGRYLLTGRLPARGTVCGPTIVPFAQPTETARRPAPSRPSPAIPGRPRW